MASKTLVPSCVECHADTGQASLPKQQQLRTGQRTARRPVPWHRQRLPRALSPMALLTWLVLLHVLATVALAQSVDYGNGNSSSGDILAPTPLNPLSPQVVAYQYVIVVGVVAVIAVLVPLHALMPQAGRVAWHLVALAAALASGIASIVGATFASRIQPNTGTIWQTIGTAICMLFLALLIQIQVVGGWHILRLRARSRGRILMATLDNSHWREDVTTEEHSLIVAASGLGSSILRFGTEPDQDAAVVAALPTMRRWAAASSDTASSQSGADASDGVSNAAIHAHAAAGGDEVVCGHADLSGRSHPRHEPSGLVLLGSVRYARFWLEDLLEVVRRQDRSSLATFHHVCILLWWVGMFCGALSKTGFNASKTRALSNGAKNFRTAGIWLQALLLAIGMYGFPYTRGLARYGTRVFPRMLLLLFQTIASFGVGVALLAVVHEDVRNHNLIAYSVALMVAATACALWCFVAVHSYQQALRILLARDPRRNLKATAYIAAIVTRPRYGYQGNTPVLRWGDVDRSGHAALEVPLEKETELSFDDGIEDRMMDNEAGSEWRMLEAAARPRMF